MEISALYKKIEDGGYNDKLTKLYGVDKVESAKTRYLNAVESFRSIYGDKGKNGEEWQVSIISVPGRSEILGNHTDHNHGQVLCAAINLDIIAVIAENGLDKINIKSEGFNADVIDLTNLAPVESEKFTSAAIIRGIAARFKELGLNIGGFNAYTTNDVLQGSGLSSSAAFEVCVGFALSQLFNGGSGAPVEIAKIGQWAENNYFGKPCGLMDQTACASGGFVTIDFRDPTDPIVEKVGFSLTDSGYSLCIVSTGGSHADLNDEYASITQEMKQIAEYFDCRVLREVDEAEFTKSISALRQKFGDRAVLRAMHFFAENMRVQTGYKALKDGAFDVFLQMITSSGNSSFKYLQNIYAIKSPQEQGISLALATAEQALIDKSAAVRVHGGGFAGTIQAFVPKASVAEFTEKIEAIFGDGACLELFVRDDGATIAIE